MIIQLVKLTGVALRGFIRVSVPTGRPGSLP